MKVSDRKKIWAHVLIVPSGLNCWYIMHTHNGLFGVVGWCNGAG